MPPAKTLKLKIERFLYKKGFTDATLRAIILAQLALLGASLLTGLILLPFSVWGLCFFLGALLISFNFWSLARFLLANLGGGYSRAFLQGQIFRFMGRLIITGAVLGVALYYRAPPVPLLLGIFACLALTGIVGVVQNIGQKS